MPITKQQVQYTLYLLKQERGTSIIYYTGTATYNLETGVKTSNRVSETIKKAIVMSKQSKNSDGVDNYDTVVIIDKNDVTSSFSVTSGDRCNIHGEVFIVVSYMEIYQGLAYKIKLRSASNAETIDE